jgi:hypothetical protein
MGFTTDPKVLRRVKAVMPSATSDGGKFSPPEIEAQKVKYMDELSPHAFVDDGGRLGMDPEHTTSATCKPVVDLCLDVN